MANPEHVKVVCGEPASLLVFQMENPALKLDLSQAQLRGVNLRGVNLRGVNLRGVNLRDANLRDANLTRANLNEANLNGANLNRANLSGANFSNADLNRVNLGGANLSNAELSGAELSGVNLSDAKLIDANLNRANLSSADLSDADLNRADFRGGNLSGAILLNANLSGGNLSGVNLSDADLSNADLLGTRIDSTTVFTRARCYRTFVDRSTAEYMRDSLTHGQLMDLRIVDDLATLRGEFSGLWGAIHLISVLVFLLPYAWFLGQQSLASKARENAESVIYSMKAWAKSQADHITFVSTEAFKTAMESKIERTAKEWREQLSLNISPAVTPDVGETTIYTAEAWATSQADHITFMSAEAFKAAMESKIERTAKEWREQLKLKRPEEVTILAALGRYIWNGGNRWREGYYFNGWSFIPFMCVAIYNTLRLSLLIKTKKLETQESVRKLPVIFNLGRGKFSWRTIYQANRIGYWVALALILKNTVYFLSSTIQI